MNKSNEIWGMSTDVLLAKLLRDYYMYIVVIYVQVDDSTGLANVFSGGPSLNRKTNDKTQ